MRINRKDSSSWENYHHHHRLTFAAEIARQSPVRYSPSWHEWSTIHHRDSWHDDAERSQEACECFERASSKREYWSHTNSVTAGRPWGGLGFQLSIKLIFSNVSWQFGGFWSRSWRGSNVSIPNDGAIIYFCWYKSSHSIPNKQNKTKNIFF